MLPQVLQQPPRLPFTISTPSGGIGEVMKSGNREIGSGVARVVIAGGRLVRKMVVLSEVRRRRP